jgi:uncharacterized protein
MYGQKITTTEIEEATRRLVETYQPQQIYLFGSYAWGEPHECSDLDFMVVLEPEAKVNFKDDRKGRLALRDMQISVDIILENWKSFTSRVAYKGSLERKIKDEGVLLYGIS